MGSWIMNPYEVEWDKRGRGLVEKKNPAQKSRVCPIYPYTYEILNYVL